MHRLQISVFGAVAIVFAVQGVNIGIFTSRPALDAMAAGWLILAIVDIIWVLYFTSEEDSLVLYFFNLLGTGGLTPPSRRRRRTQGSIHNGYATNYQAGGIGSHDMGFGQKTGSGIGSPGGGPAARSQNSFGGVASEGAGTRSIGPGSISNVQTNNTGGTGEPGSIGGDNNGPSSPLMGAGSAGAQVETPQAEAYSYKAKALYTCMFVLLTFSDRFYHSRIDTASPDDPNEISFTKGEILDIVDRQGKWWQAKKADGHVGSESLLYSYSLCLSDTVAPSNYLQII